MIVGTNVASTVVFLRDVTGWRDNVRVDVKWAGAYQHAIRVIIFFMRQQLMKKTNTGNSRAYLYTIYSYHGIISSTKMICVIYV